MSTQAELEKLEAESDEEALRAEQAAVAAEARVESRTEAGILPLVAVPGGVAIPNWAGGETSVPTLPPIAAAS